MNRSFVLLFVLGTCGRMQAQQTNSWISSTSGNWDDASSWSLGVPPANSQAVLFTNFSWKAIVIDSSTVASSPQSLAVNSLTLISPSNSLGTTKNTLLLNFAGAGNPLVVGVDTNNLGSFLIDSNSTVAMFSSGLIVNNALGETNSHIGEFQIDGNFIQSENSEVVAGFLDLNGTYNLTNGELFVGTQFINGTFNQQGGTNTGAVVAGTNGDYKLFAGAFKGDITLYPGHFEQWGGTVSAKLTFDQPAAGGVYQLMGGLLLPGDIDLGAAPVTNFNVFPSGVIEQSGGTNNPTSLTMGFGSYYLSNGVLNASSMTLITNTWAGGLYAGDFEQYGGYVTNGSLSMFGGTNEYREQILLTTAKYYLYGGTLETPAITMNVANFSLGGIGLNATNRVATLSINASIYAMGSGGFLAVNQLQIANGSQFWHMSGTLSGARNVILANGGWSEQTSGTQLGQLHLMSGANSSVSLPNGASVLQFADSSIVPWASDGILTVGGWSGSLSGGGAQQIIFGTSASGLTPQQLNQIRFRITANLYSAKILDTGEVVPDQPIVPLLTVAQRGNQLILNWQPGYTLQSSTNPGGPYQNVSGSMITSPYTNDMTSAPQIFFRLALP